MVRRLCAVHAQGTLASERDGRMKRRRTSYEENDQQNETDPADIHAKHFLPPITDRYVCAILLAEGGARMDQKLYHQDLRNRYGHSQRSDPATRATRRVDTVS